MKTQKRLVDYDAFLKWLYEQERLAGRSDREWNEAFPNCDQAVYRRGMWYAFHEAGRALPEFIQSQ